MKPYTEIAFWGDGHWFQCETTSHETLSEPVRRTLRKKDLPEVFSDIQSTRCERDLPEVSTYIRNLVEKGIVINGIIDLATRELHARIALATAVLLASTTSY